MGRRRRMHLGHDNDGAFPMKYLLPIPSLQDEEDEDPEVLGRDRHDEDDSDDYETLNLYRQAVPLLHPQSTATIKTIGKIMNNPKITQRILQRNQPTDGSGGATASINAPNCQRRMLFHKTCDEIFFGFDPATKRTGTLPIHRIPLLLSHYGLEVDEVGFRQWEQSLPGECKDVTRLIFIQACAQWFTEPFLIAHFDEWRDKHREIVARTALRSNVLAKSQSAPHLLHPFDSLARRNDDALAFSYEDYAHSPPKLRKTQEETSTSKSEAMISATQQLRRNTKTLARLNSMECLTADANLPVGRPPLPATHERLHEEKLARHILQRCGSQALLAPSNRHKSSSAVAVEALAKAGQSQNSHGQKLRQQAARKLARQQNSETAKAFSASIAMISRHVHNEELRDLRDIAHERQITVVDERKQLRRLQNAHCKALAKEKAHQQLRDVAAMKTLAEEESEVVRQFIKSREQTVRFQKPQFTLSPSTSTLFQQPPEILAAKATAKTASQKKKLLLMEREHLDHMRSIQLLDYAYDKKRAILDANEPKADATLLDLQVENLPEAQEAALAEQELWSQIVEACKESQDLTPLLPPPNSPPAALRYFSSHRPSGFLPPFTASTVTPNPVSKVP